MLESEEIITTFFLWTKDNGCSCDDTWQVAQADRSRFQNFRCRSGWVLRACSRRLSSGVGPRHIRDLEMRRVAISIVIVIGLMVPISKYLGASAPVASSPAENSKLHTPAPPPGLVGYCWPLSAASGQTIDFYVSGSSRDVSVPVRFFSHTADESGVVSTEMFIRKGEACDRSRTTRISVFPREQFTNSKAPIAGAGWRRSFSLCIPSSWPSGFYSAELGDRDRFHITFIVKPAVRRSSVAVIANVNTWLAYNNWGGASARDGLAHVSFMRPNPGASPVAPVFPYGHLTRGELWILGWLKAEGYHPDVYTDIDFDQARLLRGYSYIVLSTHPQYWTERMYDFLEFLLNEGLSVLYLGGGGIYEKADYEFTRTNNGMSFRNGVEGRPREDALLRVLRRPARRIVGVDLERCGAQGAPYQVLEACHPLFRGTGLRNGDKIGGMGLNTGCGRDCGDGNGGAAGWEIDTSNGIGARAFPTGCRECVPSRDCPRFGPPRSGPELPPNLIVLARGQNWHERDAWKGAEMVYYDHPAGGFVLSVGSIQFGGSLAIDRNLQQIIRNALTTSPARITKPYKLGDPKGLFPWLSVPRIPDTLHRINITDLTLAESCDVGWFKIIALPPVLPDPPITDCNFDLSITFPSGMRIIQVEETTGGAYRDLEVFTTSPAVITGSFFRLETLVFRVESTMAPPRRYDVTFEFRGPGIPCRH